MAQRQRFGSISENVVVVVVFTVVMLIVTVAVVGVVVVVFCCWSDLATQILQSFAEFSRLGSAPDELIPIVILLSSLSFRYPWIAIRNKSNLLCISLDILFSVGNLLFRS